MMRSSSGGGLRAAAGRFSGGGGGMIGVTHLHFAEVVELRVLPDRQRNLQNRVVVEADARGGKRLHDQRADERADVDRQAVRRARRVAAVGIAVRLRLEHRVIALRQATELVIAVGIGHGADRAGRIGARQQVLAAHRLASERVAQFQRARRRGVDRRA